ncbi:MAG: hypothetical protein Aurels2KO_52260 [Aureliella sp.]
MAETGLFSGNADIASSAASVLFSTSVPVRFLLTLSESEPGLGGVRRFSDSQNVISPGTLTTLAPGSYVFYGNADALVQRAGQIGAKSFSATLTASAVPEPTSASLLTLSGIAFGLLRKRRAHS